MSLEIPKIDSRTYDDILSQLKKIIPHYTPEWTPNEEDPGLALLKIFSHMQSYIINQFNKVPEKNLTAFYDAIGVKLLHSQAAVVPLTFHLSEGSKDHVLIPEGTQASNDDNIIFETMNNLYAYPGKLLHAYSFDSKKDFIFKCPLNIIKEEEEAVSYTGKLLYDVKKNDKIIYLENDNNLSPGDILSVKNNLQFVEIEEVNDTRVTLLDKLEYDFITGTEVYKISNFELFTGKNIQEHAVYLGHSKLFDIKEKVKFRFNDDLSRLRFLNWEYWGSDTIDGAEDWYGFKIKVKNNGKLLLIKNNNGEIKEKEINGIKSRWIRGLADSTYTAHYKNIEVENLGLSIPAGNNIFFPDMVLYNNIPINQGTYDNPVEYYPFGPKPAEAYTFYIASNEAFSKKNADIFIYLSLKQAGIVYDKELILSWEYWNGSGWNRIDISDNYDFTESGHFNFICPDDISQTNINGNKNYWIRVRIISGNYSKEKEMIYNDIDGSWTVNNEINSPPIIDSLTISYKLSVQKPEHCLIKNNLEYKIIDLNNEESHRFKPVQVIEETNNTMYLGYDKKLEKGPISILFVFEDQEFSSMNKPEIEWFYYSSDEKWKKLSAIDYTENFTKTGIVTFYLPDDFISKLLFNSRLYWLKAVDVNNNCKKTPQIRGIHINTVFGINAATIKNEVLGSSDGSISQKYKFSKNPTMNEEIWINEMNFITDTEKNKIIEKYGEDFILEIKDENNITTEIWVKWNEVNFIFESSENSRHYVLDRYNGEIKFGNGTSGMIPPSGTDNIKANYQYGGGEKGNVGTGNISVLKSSIPYVNKVTNYTASGGGSDTEDILSVLNRGSYLIKHKDRAVTIEDFERLALASSGFIARVKCVCTGGKIQIIIIPKENKNKPLPSLLLLEKVKKYLVERSLNIVRPESIVVKKPNYIEIEISANVIPHSINDVISLEKNIINKLNQYFHPLSGGNENNGWDFGRNVYLSDVYSILEGIKGVDHIENLKINNIENNILINEDETVCSGEHQIKIKIGG